MSVQEIGYHYSLTANSPLPLQKQYPQVFRATKVVLITLQSGAVGFFGYASGSFLGDPLRSSGQPYNDEFKITLSFATVLIVASLASIFFRGCKRRVHQFPVADYVANPLLVLGAYFIGVSVLSSQNSKTASEIWNNTNFQNSKIIAYNHAARRDFDYQVEDCNVKFASLIDAFTWPRCDICSIEGTTSTSSWNPKNSMEFNTLQVAQVVVNETVCESSDPLLRPLWPYFGSFNANQTLGKWPCNPNITVFHNNTSGEATAAILKAMLFIDVPFAIEATPIPNRTTSCFRVIGSGSRLFNVGIVCKYSDVILKQIPKQFLTCLTEHFYEHARNYTATYVPFVPLPQALFPGRVSQFHNDEYTLENDIFYGILGAVGFLGGITAEIEYYKIAAKMERKLLLA